MPRQYKCISGDGHIVLNPDIWRDRVQARWRDRAPKRVKMPNGSDAVVIDGGKPNTIGITRSVRVAHVDLARDWPLHTVRDALNFHLQPDPITVIEASVVAGDFSARFSAVERRYLYRILNRRAPPAVERHRVWHVPHPLDAFPKLVAADAALMKLPAFDKARPENQPDAE